MNPKNAMEDTDFMKMDSPLLFKLMNVNISS